MLYDCVLFGPIAYGLRPSSYKAVNCVQVTIGPLNHKNLWFFIFALVMKLETMAILKIAGPYMALQVQILSSV